jgi:lipoate-protein ligase A
MSMEAVVHSVTVAEEQAWNEAALDEPVQEPQLRFWRYASAGIVLGASQSSLLPQVAAQGIETVLRGSGGSAVLAGPWMLSVSAVLPADHAFARGGPMPAYEWLGRHCESAMRELGVSQAHATPDKRDAGDLKWACFAGLSPWEVTVDGRKLVGLAQRRRRQGVLVAAGVLLDAPDWPLLCRALGRSAQDAARLAASTVSCRELTGRVPTEEEVAALIAAHVARDLRAP